MKRDMRRDIILLLQEVASQLEGDYGPEDKLATECRDMVRQMLAAEPYESSPMTKARIEALNKMSRSDANKKKSLSQEARAKISTLAKARHRPGMHGNNGKFAKLS